MAKSIATFAQWNENVVDLGKTITLTINGVGSVRFEDYADFAISILGPVTNKKVNMPPDAFIGSILDLILLEVLIVVVLY